MKVFRGLPNAEARAPCALTIGNFDGVHRGHQALLGHVREAASRLGLDAAVMCDCFEKGRATEAIPLADLVAALRQELTIATSRAEGQAIQFTLGDIELELNVAVTRQKSAQGGVQFWVFSLGGSGGWTDATTHTIRLTLHPQSASGASPTISGSVPVLPE